jgi:hypothetical protein
MWALCPLIISVYREREDINRKKDNFIEQVITKFAIEKP